MDRALGFVVSVVFVGVGLAGMIRPKLLRSSLEELYAPAKARVSGLVLLLLGLAGIWAILNYPGGPSDFSPV